MRARRAGRAVALLIIVAGACTLAAQSQQPIVRSGTQIVRVIVLARDRSGKPVPGLKADDFAVAEDGKPQDIAFFDAHSAITPSAVAPGPSATPTAGQSTAFSNLVAVDRVRNVTVILLDRLNAAWTDQAQARDGIRKFLAQVRPDDRVALYALDGTALRVLHDFTSDTAALLQTVSGAARMTSPAAEAQNAAAEPMLGPDLRTGLDSPEHQLQVVGAAAYTTITALQAIGRHLAGVPGRKSIVWISSAFPSGALLVHATDRTNEIQRATRALNTAGVSVYPIDARGLIGAFSDPGTATRPPTFATLDTVHANTDVLRSIADDTGGRLFMNTNDISGAIRGAIDDAETYYVIGYYPPAGQNDGRYRQIEVKTQAGGVDLRYRHGYFTTPADIAGGDRKTSLERTIRDVLDSTGIPVTVTVVPGGPNQDTELSIAADGRAIALRQAQGTWTGAVDLVIAQVHDDGTLHLDTDTTIALKLSDAQRDALLESGLTLTRHIAVAANTARLAVVVRDSNSGTLGSVFVPSSRLRPAR